MAFRPWGNIRWLLPKVIAGKSWTFCGCISAEERCLGAYNELRQSAISMASHFIIVDDPESKFTPEIQAKTNDFKKILESWEGGLQATRFELEYSDMSKIYAFIHELIERSDGNLILDISCFPKRFFFPFIKWIYKSEKVNNLIVLNTTANKYRSGRLAENFAEWDTIPFFSDYNEGSRKDTVFISVGHMPMASLDPIQDIASSEKIQLFFPFPGHPDSFMHTWKFVYDIRELFPERNMPSTIRVSAANCSELYEHLIVKTEDIVSRNNVLLAPFGPKPFSLAMALFATKYDAPVYYTQPRLYYPDYSSDIGMKNGKPGITAYAIILQGRKLY